MKPSVVLLFLAMIVLLVSTEARRKSSSSKKSSSGRGSASQLSPLRSSKNRKSDVQNNAAVKKAVVAMKSGKNKGSGRLSQAQDSQGTNNRMMGFPENVRRGGASPSNMNKPPSASNLNQPQGYPSQKRPLSPSNMNQPQSAGAPNYNQGPPSASNMNQPPPSYQQAMGGYGAPPPYGAPSPYGAPQHLNGGGQAMGVGMQYPGAYPGGQMQPGMGAPMGYPMMPPMMPMMGGQQQQQAPAPKKGLIPNWMKPQLMIDVVPLAMMAAKPIKSLFSRNDHKMHPDMKRRLKAGNGTDNSTGPDGNGTFFAGPPFPFPNSNGSDPNFPMPIPPPPMEDENGTYYQPQPQFPFMPSYQPYYDANGTAQYPPPRPFFPYGMFSPPMYARNENESSYGPAYPYGYGYQPYAPYANPFYRRNYNMQNESMQVGGPMIAVEPPHFMKEPPMQNPDDQLMVDPPMISPPEGEDGTVPVDGEKKPLIQIETKLEVAEEPQGDAGAPKTGVVYANKNILLDSLVKPAMVAMAA